MSTLVFLEHHDGEIQKGSLGVLAKATSLGDADAVLVGEGVRGLAADAGRHGAKTVHVADDASLAAPLSQPRVDVLAKLASEYDAVFFANSVLAADVAAGLAARLDAGLNWDLVDITADFVGKRPALQDSVLVDVGWKSTPRLASSAPARSIPILRRVARPRCATSRSSSRTSRPRRPWWSRRTPRRPARRSRTRT